MHLKYKRLFIFGLITLVIIILGVAIYNFLSPYKETYNKQLIQQTYDTNLDLLISYSNRTNNGDTTVVDELNSLIISTKDPTYLGTYKNALGYYYLRSGDYYRYENLSLQAIDLYSKSEYTGPLILNTYRILISNSISQMNFNSALKYCYEASELANSTDYKFMGDNFLGQIELTINCSLINIFYNNDLSTKSTKYFNKINAIDPNSELYKKNELLIIFSKLLYFDGIGNYNEALKHSNDYFNISAANNSPNLEGLRINLAKSLLANKMPDEALDHIIAATNFYESKNNIFGLATSLIAYGDYHFQKNNYSESTQKYIEAYNSLSSTTKFNKLKKDIIIKIKETKNTGNLNIDISNYLEEYVVLNNDINSNESIASLFLTMEDVHSKSLESKIELLEREHSSLKQSTLEKIKLIALLATFSILFMIATIYLSMEVKRRKLYQSQLQTLINTDALTGCTSRACGIDLISNLIKSKSNFCLAIIDIDNFKKINDTYGHNIGDKALMKLGTTLRNTFQSTGTAIRYGGEEFIIIIKDRNLDESIKLMDDFRNRVASERFHDSLTQTISCGLVIWNGEDLNQLINEADKLLYEAKNTGKNKICY